MNIKKLSILFTVMLTFSMSSFAQSNTDYSLASVGKKIYGVFIFLGSEPANEYQYIATVKVKITWSGSQRESFEKVIKKSKKKYPYFNGMIFHTDNFDEVDLIKFEGLDASRGGIKIDSKVSFIRDKHVFYGSVVELESSKGKGSVKYLDVFAEEQVRKVSYTDLTPISDEDYYAKKSEVKEESKKYQFSIGETVTFVKKDLINGSALITGEIVELDSKYHKASIQYTDDEGEKHISKTSYLDLTKVK